MKSIDKRIIVVLFLIVVMPVSSAAWANTSFLYRAPININNVGNATTLTNYSVNLSITYTSGMNTSFADLRVYNDTTAVPYWIEYTNTVNGSRTNLWFNVTSIPASSWLNNTYYLYYGNATVFTTSNGASTFLNYTTSLPNGGYSAPVNTALRFNASFTANAQQLGYTTLGAPPRISFYTDTALIPDLRALHEGITDAITGATDINTGYAVYDIIRNGSTDITYKINGTSTTFAAAFSTVNIAVDNVNAPGFKWLAIRKYAYQEPAASLGAQQPFSSFIPIVASNTIQYSYDPFIETSSIPYVKLYEFTSLDNYSGSWKINYTALGEFGGFGYGRLKKNGINYGGELILPFGSWITESQIFTNITINKGDTIELWGHTLLGTSAYYKDFRIMFDYDYVNATPILTYPVNGSTISFQFPPQFADITFAWDDIATSGYQIQVAKDINFNLIAWDVTSTTNSKTLPLEADVWYWRVRTYNNGTAGNAWSSISSFTFSETAIGISGTTINGVVFEYIGGVQTPISGASVYLTNSTFTTSALTGSNGYFLFDGLTNSTYSLYSIKQGYDNSQIFAVTPTTNATTTVNLPMRIYISPFVPNFVFEKFIIRSLFDAPYQGVTVNIYVGSSLTPSFTGTTDSMGQVVFQLIKDTFYRIEISGGGLPSTISAYFYGKEETYLITTTSGFPSGGDKFKDVNATLFVTSINSTHANLSLYYNDNSSTTSIINFYAQYYGNGTSVCNGAVNSTIYPVTLNCTVVKGNNTYLFGWNATSSKYGIMQGADVVNFAASNTSAPQVIGTKMSTSMLNWISILSLVFVAGLFSAKSVKFGVVIVPFVAVIFYWAGTLQVNSIIVHTALVLGVLAYIRMSEHKVIS